LEARDTPSAGTLVTQSFDTTALGSLPAGWAQYSKDAGFAVSDLHALSGTHGLTGTASSGNGARAWLTTVSAADVQVSASVFLDSLIPAQVFARGANLAGDSPTYYEVNVQRGFYAELRAVQNGVTRILATVTSAQYFSQKWLTVTLSVSGHNLSVQFYRPDTGQYLDRSGRWQSTPTSVLQVSDSAITAAGYAGVGRLASYDGTVTFDNFAEAAAAGAAPIIPQHYSWIRIAELAYSGTPMGSFEDNLLRYSVDLVVPDIGSLGSHIQWVAPGTPQLAYENTSNLYQSLLLDWLNYADAHYLSREAAFYHAAQPIPFSGTSPSSQPVNWFWGVYLGGDSVDYTDLTTVAHVPARAVTFGAAGQSLDVGYPEKFREINLNLAQGARNGWSAILEYPSAVDAAGNPTAWSPLPLLSDATYGLSRSGQILFDPPADWKPAVTGGTARLYYVRFRTILNGQAPVANTILGRDYVNAGGQNAGTIPVFDYAADTNHDGYLSDAEYAHRARGKDARFAYESRVFYGNYGQGRFATNPGSTAFRNWAVDYSLRYLNGQPLADGLFMDNSSGNLAIPSASVVESTATYAADYAAVLGAVGRAISPRWVLANTSGGDTTADPIVSQTAGYFEEFALRPLAQSWQQFESLAAEVARRAGLRSPAPYAVIDSLPTGGSPTDARTQLATLAAYYLVADPKTTFLDFYGGFEPATSWTRHWSPAVTYNVGQPTGAYSLLATGADPANHALTYRVYQRTYGNALVLYKPLSYTPGTSTPGTTADATATWLPLKGTYRPLRADGTLGSPVTGVLLRNGEGAILVKA
jgi:hypothetical protein